MIQINSSYAFHFRCWFIFVSGNRSRQQERLCILQQQRHIFCYLHFSSVPLHQKEQWMEYFTCSVQDGARCSTQRYKILIKESILSSDFLICLDNYRHEHFKCFLDKQVWVYAAAQVFNSIGIAFGLLISFASYNKFHGPILRDTLIVVLVDALTCILCGIIVFATMGNLAFTQGKYYLIVIWYFILKICISI